MSSPFAITSATNSVRLDAQRHGEAAFTVTNASGRPIRGRARLAADNPAAAAWLSLAGEVERDLPIAGTTQYSVQIAVPPTAPPGSYPFRLNMVGVENPDELFTEGPSVTFEVPAPPAPKKAFPWWILVIAGAVLVGLIVTALVLFLPRNVAVPDVAGLSVEAAHDALAEVGLDVAVPPLSEPSETVAENLVTRSDPPAGEQAKKGSEVTLVVSTGSEFTTVPDVANQTVAQAQATLQGASLQATGVYSQPHDLVAVGSVIATNPAAGTKVKRGTPVILLVSTGPAFVTVPDVSGQDQATAQGMLVGAGLQVGATALPQPSDTVPAGSVIGTNPAAGTKVAPGTEVALIVSSGPAAVVIPNVAGQSVADAQAKLENAGLQVASPSSKQHDDTVPTGQALGTNPPAGTEVTPGSTVTLLVSTGPLGSLIDDFVCDWTNTDANTGGMTRLTIAKVNDSAVSFHGYGSCSPTDCDWGVINVPFTPMQIIGSYNFSFKTTTISVARSGNLLRATVFDHYAPGDGRPDTTSVYEMQCQPWLLQPIKIPDFPLIVVPNP